MKIICEICKKVNKNPDCVYCFNDEETENYRALVYILYKEKLGVELTNLDLCHIYDLKEMESAILDNRSSNKIYIEKLENPNKNKFYRAVSKKHDYCYIYNTYLSSLEALENADKKTIDSASDYANNWVISTACKEGLHFLFRFPWNVISFIFGSRKYHKNVLESINLYADDLDQLLQIKQEELEKASTPKIGFSVK